MATVTQNDIQEAQAYLASVSLLALSDGDLVLSVEKLEYQGFDPYAFLSYLFAVAKKAGIGEAEHTKHLQTLAVLGTMRGGKAKKIAEKSTPETKRWLESMIQKYSITSGRPTGSKDVTLLRIAACHAAPIAIGISTGLAVKTTINPRSMHENYAPYMCLSTFGSLIPVVGTGLSSDDVRLISDAFTYHQRLFDRVINPRAPNSKETLKSYVDIQYMSGLYEPEMRLQVCMKLGLITGARGTYTINAGVKPALQHAAGELLE
uniref:Nucleoprotein n=1 Tax=Gouleako virus TaxID=603003 RepID=A0A0A0Q8B3_9VIRU|nr:nucleocapsid protein [Gouleako virus]